MNHIFDYIESKVTIDDCIKSGKFPHTQKAIDRSKGSAINFVSLTDTHPDGMEAVNMLIKEFGLTLPQETVDQFNEWLENNYKTADYSNWIATFGKKPAKAKVILSNGLIDVVYEC